MDGRIRFTAGLEPIDWGLGGSTAARGVSEARTVGAAGGEAKAGGAGSTTAALLEGSSLLFSSISESVMPGSRRPLVERLERREPRSVTFVRWTGTLASGELDLSVLVGIEMRTVLSLINECDISERASSEGAL